MSISRVIEVSFGGGSIAYAKVDTAYFYNNGIIFKPTDIDLPASYQVHWADSPQASSTLETIGTAEGAPIPNDLWSRSRVIYGWIYLHPTEDSGVTGYEVRIYKNVRAGLPDGTEPTPAEQSIIDQAISALNTAVAKTAQDVIDAGASAQSASRSAENAHDSAVDAQNYAESAQTSATQASTSASQASASATASAESASASAQIKADVDDLVDDAQSYAESALIASQASVTARNTAQGYAQSASASAQSASGYASNAQTSANTASSKATEASTSAQTASTKATEASQSASQALSYKTDAESAKTASQTAQGLAESARDTAVSAKTDAESARDDAETARDEAQSAVASISGALDEKAPVITDTASGAIASFSDGADDLPLKSLVVDINPVQDLSHGDPSPENICPISGWTEVGVEQRGVNVWDEEWEVGGISSANGSKYNDNNRIRSKNFIPVKPSTKYYFAMPSTFNAFKVAFYGLAKDFLSFNAYKNNVITTPSNCYWLMLSENGTDYGTTYNHDISINYPSSDHDYHPYTGRSITIDLGQTVYGGKLDVLSGGLTVDRAMVDLGTLNWGASSAQSGMFYTTGLRSVINAQSNNIVCSQYTKIASISSENNVFAVDNIGTVYFKNLNYDGSSAAEFKSAMSGVQLCYELATPIEIQLSANQLNSLYGQNNIWADSGDTEVEYRADTKAYIAKKIAEAIASLT